MSRNPVPLVWQAITTTEWAMLPDRLPVIFEIAARETADLNIEAVAAKLGRPLQNSHAVTMRGGVAVIPIEGVIFPRATLFTAISGGVTADQIAQDIATVMTDPNVTAVLLNVDSPGGNVNGVAEVAEFIYRARQRKPIYAYVRDLGASAAYWLASAAEEVVVASTAQVGSIGVIGTVPKPDDEGSPSVQFISSQSPHKRPNPMTDEGKQRIQARIDALAAVFIDAVARYRGVQPVDVLARYGAGDVLIGQEAVDAGLADRVGSFEETVARLQAKPARPTSRPLPLAADAPPPTLAGDAPVPDNGRDPATQQEGTMTPEELKALADSVAEMKAEVQANTAKYAALESNFAGEVQKAVEARAEELRAEMAANLAAANTRALAAEAEVATVKAQAQGAASYAASLKAEKRRTGFMDEVRGKSAASGLVWDGDIDAHVNFLEAVADQFGDDSAQVQHYITSNRAFAAKLAANPQAVGYAELGDSTPPAGVQNSAEQAIEAAVVQYRAAHPGLGYEAAYLEVLQQQPALFERYNREHPSNKR